MTLRRIAHFEILEPIGKGGMGVVYRARDTHLDRLVAIKLLPASFSTNPDRRSRFLREARAAANLNHPNIATVYQFGPAEVEDPELVTPPPGSQGAAVEILFLAMELVPGEDLHTLLEAGPLPVETALDYGIQIAQGLEAAHRAGVTHRDLKPKNVRVTPEGLVKILDFGLAKVHGPEIAVQEGAGERAFETTQGMVLGTPPYMAPEQLRGEAVDARADLYALGMVLYQMFTGRLPYPSKNLLEYAKALAAAGGPPSMIQARSEATRRPGTVEIEPDIGEEHESIVRRLLHQEPEARPANAREVITALKAVSSWESGVTHPGGEAPTVVRGPAAAATPKPPRIRGRPGWVVATLAVLAAVILAVFFLRSGTSTPGKIQVVVLPFDVKVEDAEEGKVLALRLVQELEGSLVRLDGVEIISSREAAPLISRDERLSRVADILGADCLLLGTLTANDRLNIQLLQGEGALVHWDFTFTLGAGFEDFDSESAMLRLVASAVKLWRGTRDSLEGHQFRELGEAEAGEIDALSGDLETATALFQQALKMDPNDADAHAALSQVYYQLLRQSGDRQYLEKVQRHADRALEINPDHVEAHIARGRYLRFQGKFDAAIAELEQAVKLAPASDLATFELAVSQEQAGALEGTLANLKKVVEIRPEYWFYRNQLGVILMEYFGQLDLARGSFEMALEQAAGSQKYWPMINLGVLEILEGNYAAAVEWLEEVPEANRDATVANNLGTAYFRLLRFEEAAEQYREAIRMNPADGGYWRGLGDALVKLGQPEEAMENYRSALDKLLAGDAPESWRKSLYLAKVGRCPEAIQVARDARGEIEAYPPPTLASLLVEFAKTMTVCGRSDAALDLLLEAHDLGYQGSLRNSMELEGLAGEPRFEELADPSQ